MLGQTRSGRAEPEHMEGGSAESDEKKDPKEGSANLLCRRINSLVEIRRFPN